MKHLHLRENWYRDIWLFAVTVFVAIAVKAAMDNVTEIQNGRKAGTVITCVITSSVLQGGHAFIIDSAAQPLPKKLEQRLVAEGYPSKAVRERAARAQADAYTEAIQRAVISAVGEVGKGLIAVHTTKTGTRVTPAGTVNCQRLKTVSKVP